MKHFFIIIFVLTLVLGTTSSVFAQASAGNNGNGNGKANGQMKTMELQTTMPSNGKPEKDVLKARPNPAAKASDSATSKKRVHIMNAEVTAISGTTLTIAQDGKTMTVTTNAKTLFKRNFGGLSTLAEFTVGDKVDVLGMWSDTSGTTIAASLVRNRSIMKRRGAFVGEVVSKTGNTIVLKTVARGNLTITVVPTTKYTDRTQVAITLTDILAGHKLLVKGMFDKANNTVTQVTTVKDFTLPLKSATGSAEPINASPSAEANL